LDEKEQQEEEEEVRWWGSGYTGGTQSVCANSQEDGASARENIFDL
jgi:hypothetical protein